MRMPAPERGHSHFLTTNEPTTSYGFFFSVESLAAFLFRSSCCFCTPWGARLRRMALRPLFGVSLCWGPPLSGPFPFPLLPWLFPGLAVLPGLLLPWLCPLLPGDCGGPCGCPCCC